MGKYGCFCAKSVVVLSGKITCREHKLFDFWKNARKMREFFR